MEMVMGEKMQVSHYRFASAASGLLYMTTLLNF